MKKIRIYLDEVLSGLVKLRSDELVLNSFYLMATTVTMACFGFVFWFLVAKLYTSDQVGVASTLVAAMNFITYVALLGFNTTFIRFLPTSKKRSKQIDTGLILVMIAGLLISLGYALIASHYTPDLRVLTHHWYYTLGFALLVAFYSVNLLTDSIYVAYRSTKYKLLFSGIIAGTLQLLFAFMLHPMRSFGIFASYGIAGFVAMLLSILLLITKFSYKPRFVIDGETLKEVVSYSSSNYVANLLNILPTMLLPMIIINKLGASAAGYFYLAFMMGTLLFTIAYAVSQTMFAEGSYNSQHLFDLLKKSLKIVFAVMVPASLIMAIFGPIVLQLYGKEYAEGARSTVIILAATGPFVAIYILGGTLLRILKRTRALIVTNAVYIVTICGLAFAWASRGLAWVAFAWLLGHVITSLLLVAYFYLHPVLLNMTHKRTIDTP